MSYLSVNSPDKAMDPSPDSIVDQAAQEVNKIFALAASQVEGFNERIDRTEKALKELQLAREHWLRIRDHANRAQELKTPRDY